jgi:hypothetical protein
MVSTQKWTRSIIGGILVLTCIDFVHLRLITYDRGELAVAYR